MLLKDALQEKINSYVMVVFFGSLTHFAKSEDFLNNLADIYLNWECTIEPGTDYYDYLIILED